MTIIRTRLGKALGILAVTLVVPAATAQSSSSGHSVTYRTTNRTPTKASGTVTYQHNRTNRYGTSPAYRGTYGRSAYRGTYPNYRTRQYPRPYVMLPPVGPYAVPPPGTAQTLPPHVVNPNLPVQPNYGGNYQGAVQPHYGAPYGNTAYPNVQPYQAPGAPSPYGAVPTQPGMVPGYPGAPMGGGYPPSAAALQGPGSVRVQNQTGEMLNIVIGGRQVGTVYPNGEQTFTGLMTGKQPVVAMTAAGHARFRSAVDVPPSGQGFWTIRKYTPSTGAVPGATPPAQPGAYPPAQPGAYPPAQPGAYPPAGQPGATGPAQPGAFPPAQPGATSPPAQPGAVPPAQPGTTPPAAGSTTPTAGQAFPPGDSSTK